MEPITVLSLFNGMSCAYMALEQAEIPVKTYYSSEIDKYAIAESQENFPDIIQLGDVTKWEDWDIDWGNIDLLMGGFPCFPEGTMIMTNKGHKDIKDIVEGDYVLTHNGRYHKVLSTGTKLAPTRVITGMGHLPIECTDNHPFYARTLSSVWNNDLRRTERVLSSPEWVEAKDLTPEHMICNVLPEDNHEWVSLERQEYWYFMGRFLGDGWTYKVRRKKRKNSFQYRVFICCAYDEFDELKRCFDGIGMKYNYVKDRTAYKFCICSQELVEFCEKMGKGASEKKVHPDLWEESIENKKSFLKGYLDADGHISDGKHKFTTTSSELVLGIQQLIMEIYGRHITVTKSIPNEQKDIENRTVNQKPYYVGTFSTTSPVTEEAFYDNDTYAWVKGCKGNISTGEWKTVYNIEVANDNSYTANNIVVHNCQAWSVAGKQGGPNDPRGMLFHTMIDIFNHIKSVNPDVKYLFENVKMKKDFEEYCSGIIGRTPHLINSQHYTAHFRQRYYWVSTDNYIVPPALLLSPDLSSILESGHTDRTKSYCIDANYFKGGDCNQYFNKSRRQIVFSNPNIVKEFLLENGKNGVDYRKLSVVECCRLQGVPDDFFKVSSNTQSYKMLGNGWTVPVIEHLLREIFYG